MGQEKKKGGGLIGETVPLPRTGECGRRDECQQIKSNQMPSTAYQEPGAWLLEGRNISPLRNSVRRENCPRCDGVSV